MTQNALELKDVCKNFEEFSLSKVSFKLPKGFIMGFIGPNGAGKTTTIKLILNMLTRNDGSINVFELDNVDFETQIKDKIGVVMDNIFYQDEWKVSGVGKILKPFYSSWNQGTFEKLLSDFSLNGQKKIKDLSRGMKMKLMIACALSHNAELLILDEPTSGLDAVARNELLDILTSFIEDQNKSVLFSTHITADLERIADYITFINDGKILYSGTKDELLEKYLVVKGGLGILTSEQKALIVGFQEHNFAFDGVIEKENSRYFPHEIVTERANLDELVVRFNIGGKQK